MNTTIESVLYTSKTLSNGEHPLMLRLTKNRKRKYVSLHLSLSAQFWDFAKNRPKRNCPHREQIIQLIDKKTRELQEQVIDFKTNVYIPLKLTLCTGVVAPFDFCFENRIRKVA